MSCGCHNYQIKGFNYKPKKLYCEARFYSPDLYIQAPDMAQNFNRYTYCMNNPLIYSYPRGMSWFSDIWDGFWSLINGDYNLQTGQFVGGVAQIFRNMNIPYFQVGYDASQGFFHSLGNGNIVYHDYVNKVEAGISKTMNNFAMVTMNYGAKPKISREDYLAIMMLDVDANSDGSLEASNATLEAFAKMHFPRFIYKSYANLIYREGYVESIMPDASAFTDPEMVNGKYNVYFSKASFNSRWDLFMEMGHEHIHVAQKMLHMTDPVYREVGAYTWNDKISKSDYYRNGILISKYKYNYKALKNQWIQDIIIPKYSNYAAWCLPLTY